MPHANKKAFWKYLGSVGKGLEENLGYGMIAVGASDVIAGLSHQDPQRA